MAQSAGVQPDTVQPIHARRARRARHTSPAVPHLIRTAPPPQAPTGKHAKPAPPADTSELRAEAPFTTVDLVELMRSDAPPKGRPHDHEAVDHVARYAEQAELARSQRAAAVEPAPVEEALAYTVLPLEPGADRARSVVPVAPDEQPVAYRHQQIERRRAARHSSPQRNTARPVGTATWLALAAALGFGVLMLARTQALWIQIAGYLLLLALVPACGFAVARGIKHGFGSKTAMAITAFFFVLAALRLSYFL